MPTISGKCQCAHHNRRDSPVEFEVLSDNGIVRMDMSKIIDRTGLPTYDAAIKLESFGYVWSAGWTFPFDFCLMRLKCKVSIKLMQREQFKWVETTW